MGWVVKAGGVWGLKNDGLRVRVDPRVCMEGEDYACCWWYLLESEVLLMVSLLSKALVDAKKMFVSLQTNAQ